MSVAGWAKRHSIGLTLSGGAIAAHVAAFGFFAGHNPYTQTIFPPCIILHLTGWQCPGCGGTRALYSLLQGDIAVSLAMNPLVIASYLAVAVGLGGVLVDRGRHHHLARVLYWMAGALVIGATVYGALIRNLL